MKDKEYAQIESQALGIVDTINSLKKEIEGYSKARIASEENYESLNFLIDRVADAAQTLSDTATTLAESDYGSILSAIDTRAEEFANKLDQRLDEQKASDDLINRFENLDSSIKRVEQAVQEGSGGKSEELTTITEALNRIHRDVRLSRTDVSDYARDAQQQADDLSKTLEDVANQAQTRDANMSDTLAAIARSVVGIAESVAQSTRSIGNLQSQIYEIKDVLARVDRNTQKGFGKERG